MYITFQRQKCPLKRLQLTMVDQDGGKRLNVVSFVLHDIFMSDLARNWIQIYLIIMCDAFMTWYVLFLYIY